MDVAFDHNPYVAYSTGLTNFVPLGAAPSMRRSIDGDSSVIVNGALALRDGQRNSAGNGRALRAN
jgi:hypothetical protein